MADPDLGGQRCQESANQTLSNHLECAIRLRDLGAGHSDEQTQNTTDLDIAIQCYQESINQTPFDHPERATRLRDLGTRHHKRYQRTGNITDLDAAIQRFRESIDQTPLGHPERATRLHSLGAGYQDRYQRAGNSKDLDAAIERYQESVDQMPFDDPERARQLQNLGSRYCDRYQRIGNVTDLNTAIERVQESINQTPSDHPERAARLQSLGAGYYKRHQRTRNATDLDTAIQLFQESINQTPLGHPNLATRLRDIGAGYHKRYQRTGITTDLDTAIQWYQKSINQTPSDHLERATRLQSLGAGYGDRYQRTGNSTDLDMAIQWFQESIDLTSSDHPERSRRLQSLGAGHHSRYQRTGNTTDIDAAIQWYQASVDQTPCDHPDRAARLRDLGAGYQNRYLQTGNLTDLDTAIQQFQESVNQTPLGHLERAIRLRNLGAGYGDRYIKTGNTTDLDIAIQWLQECVDQTLLSHPKRATRLRDLGAGYYKKYQRTGNTTDLDTAIQRFQESASHVPSPIRERLITALSLVPIYADAALWNEACEVADTAMQLVPLLAPQFLKNADKQYLLAMVSGLAADSGAVAFSSGKSPFYALQLLELGRGVITGSLSEMRTDATALMRRHPRLGQEFINIRNLLDLAELPKGSSLPHSSNSRLSSRYDAWNRMEELLSNIRSQQGFENFLLPPKREEIQRVAIAGPLIIINVSQYRCDAILVEQHDIRSLELSKLRSEDIKEKTRKRDFGSPETLEWIWHTIASPVLEALHLTHSPPNGKWPHIWWIPIGSLAKFPLHAAGIHNKDSSETVIDRAMSSYGSSVKAIMHGRLSSHLDGTQASPQALLVAVPSAPGSLLLPFAKEEIATLHKLCKEMGLDPIEPGRRTSDVVSHLSQCKIFHFAGHGFTDSSDPSKSYLLLDDGKKDPLTVSTLLEMNVREQLPFLAYLSACGTGQINDDSLLDESIHLISAFQLIGFRHVVGTLWEVKDEVCVEVASITYEGIRDGCMTDESVCLGLHNACRKLRDDWLSTEGRIRGLKNRLETINAGHDDQRDERLPRDAVICEDDEEGSLSWVPYVHYGV